MRNKNVYLLLAALGAGCAVQTQAPAPVSIREIPLEPAPAPAPAPYVMRSTLDHTAMLDYLRDGKTKITGQAFLKTQGGDVKYGAGESVRLYPAVSYAIEFNRISGDQLRRAQGLDDKWYKYIRSTIADGGGNFEFENIPPGNYYIETAVFWKIPTRYGPSTQGGTVRKMISVPREGILKVILTD